MGMQYIQIREDKPDSLYSSPVLLRKRFPEVL